jgi:hypothetical protein
VDVWGREFGSSQFIMIPNSPKLGTFQEHHWRIHRISVQETMQGMAGKMQET